MAVLNSPEFPDYHVQNDMSREEQAYLQNLANVFLLKQNLLIVTYN